MKLPAGAAAGYLARPDPNRAGILLYGADAMRVALARQQVVAALIGPEGEGEMRLTRLSGADLRKDATLAVDAVRAVAFFPGPRAVVIEDATEPARPAITAALADWRPGDGVLVVTAGALGKASGLRKLFEAHPNAYALGLYDDPLSRREIESAVQAARLPHTGPDAMAAIEALARQLDPGDFRQTLEKLALYKLSDPGEVTADDVAAIAPASHEGDIDSVLASVAGARVGEIGPAVRRLAGQGVSPVALCIAATRHFRTLLTVAADPGGPVAGVAALRPPAFGPRRDRLLAEARRWPVGRLETALRLLIDTDLALRSASRAPPMALVERALIRLAMTGRGPQN